MTILVNNPAQATLIFSIIFFVVFILTIRPRKEEKGFQFIHSQELKGLAMFAIIFSHIGYFLVNGDQFLFPLSVAAGVGVNLFLFLSGYGLTISAFSKHLSIVDFYKRRLSKLYPSLWLVVVVFVILDFFITKRVYSFSYIAQSLLGLFRSADLWLDINSPLWYVTLIIFYYLLFPLFFSRKYFYLSAILFYLAGYFVIFWDPLFLSKVIKLYHLHILAFPLGVFIGGLVFRYKDSIIETFINKFWIKIEPRKILKKIIYYLFLIFLFSIIVYVLKNSHVDDGYKLEQGTSLLTCGLILVLFAMKKFESRLLYVFGFYSYEIYLLHWSIMSRFDIFYKYLPAWLATIFYLIFFVCISWALRYAINSLICKIRLKIRGNSKSLKKIT